MLNVKAMGLSACLMISSILFAQVPITGNFTVNPGNFDPTGYDVINGTLIFDDGGSGVPFQFNPGFGIRVRTGGYLDIQNGQLVPGGNSWNGIQVDGVAATGAGGYKVTLDFAGDIVISGAINGIHCIPTQSTGAPGVAADIRVYSGSAQYNFENIENDILIENTEYTANTSVINAEYIGLVHFRGSTGVALNNIDLVNTMQNLDFTQNQLGMRLIDSKCILERSKFDGQEIAVYDEYNTIGLGGSRFISNTFQEFQTGFRLNSTLNMVLEGNRFSSGSLGVVNDFGSSVGVIDNDFLSVGTAMEYNTASNSYVGSNVIKGGHHGMLSSSAESIDFIGNHVTNITGKAYYGEGDRDVYMWINEYLDCSTTENTVSFVDALGIQIGADLFKYSNQEVTNTYHSALYLESSSGVQLLRNQFRRYKYNALRVLGNSNMYDLKTCINGFAGDIQEAIRIECPITDQGNTSVHSNNWFNLNFANGNQVVVSSDPVSFYFDASPNFPNYTPNSTPNVNHVLLTGSNGCANNPLFDFQYRQANSDVVDESKVDSEISIYPNPVIDVFIINAESYNSDLPISITNILGQKVEGILVDDMTFDISHLDQGCYIVNIPLKDGSIVIQKVIKK